MFRLSFLFISCGLWTLSCDFVPHSCETLKWLSSLPSLMQESFWWWQCSDWLMIAYSALFSALLRRLTALACGSTWVTSFFFYNALFFLLFFFFHRSGVLTALEWLVPHETSAVSAQKVDPGEENAIGMQSPSSPPPYPLPPFPLSLISLSLWFMRTLSTTFTYLLKK